MFKKIVIVLVVLIGAILAYAATQPATFRVERSATISAAPEKLFPLIDDFHRWAEWSPWEKLDPAMERTFSPTASGKGATYAWRGNSDVGAGKMEIKESVPNSKITIQLDFLEPFAATSVSEFTLEPQGSSTTVHWVMSGNNNYIAKVMCVFVSMDKMVGKDFETGLANMKAAAEK
ncbi:MAG: SRPBCC family protein [Planctomycetes bacterium]|nr:SRPBCC family protein [Planctomycetota bacterium]